MFHEGAGAGVAVAPALAQIFLHDGHMLNLVDENIRVLAQLRHGFAIAGVAREGDGAVGRVEPEGEGGIGRQMLHKS